MIVNKYLSLSQCLRLYKLYKSVYKRAHQKNRRLRGFFFSKKHIKVHVYLSAYTFFPSWIAPLPPALSVCFLTLFLGLVLLSLYVWLIGVALPYLSFPLLFILQMFWYSEVFFSSRHANYKISIFQNSICWHSDICAHWHVILFWTFVKINK